VAIQHRLPDASTGLGYICSSYGAFPARPSGCLAKFEKSGKRGAGGRISLPNLLAPGRVAILIGREQAAVDGQRPAVKQSVSLQVHADSCIAIWVVNSQERVHAISGGCGIQTFDSFFTNEQTHLFPFNEANTRIA
jgi:hypothetical protein